MSVADVEAVQVAIRILRTKEKVIYTCVLLWLEKCITMFIRAYLAFRNRLWDGGRFVLFKTGRLETTEDSRDFVSPALYLTVCLWAWYVSI